MDGIQANIMNTTPFISHLLTSKGRNLVLDAPKIMAILNCTPDSFFDGGRHATIQAAAKQGLDLLDQGAHILDIGGQSTRPGASHVGVEEEWNRIGGVIEEILLHKPDTWISVDTFHAEVAQRALQAGAAMINDVSSGTMDPSMFAVVAENEVPLVLMHMQGTPETMQHEPQYENVVDDVYYWLEKRVKAALSDRNPRCHCGRWFRVWKNIGAQLCLAGKPQLISCVARSCYGWSQPEVNDLEGTQWHSRICIERNNSAACLGARGRGTFASCSRCY